jgi:hypothetical protein
MAQWLLLGSASLTFNDTPIRALRSMTGDRKRGRGFLRALFPIAILLPQPRAFGSFIPVWFPVPDAAREFRFIRSSDAVPVAPVRAPGDVVLDDA